MSPRQDFDQTRYEGLRYQLLDRNEANINNIYLDVKGIPTVGLGVALVTRQQAPSGARWVPDRPHIDALSDVLGLAPEQRRQMFGLMERQAFNQNQHPGERYQNLRAFLTSSFGQRSREIFGEVVNTRHTTPGGTLYSWDVLRGSEGSMRISLTDPQSRALFQRIAPTYESRLEGVLKRAHCPADALSEEQRAALYSMVYQGAISKARNVADTIGHYWRGKITERELHGRLKRAVHDPGFVERSNNELDFLDRVKLRPSSRSPQPSDLSPQSKSTSHDGQTHADLSLKDRLTESDRKIFDRIRTDVGGGIADASVLQATADFRRTGMDSADAIKWVGVHEGAIFITTDHRTGFLHSKTPLSMAQPNPDDCFVRIAQAEQEQQARSEVIRHAEQVGQLQSPVRVAS